MQYMRWNYNIFYTPIFLILTLAFVLFSCGGDEKEEQQTDEVLTVEEQIISLNKSIQSSPSAKLYHQRARLYNSQSSTKLAIDDMHEALRMDSTKGEYYFELAKLLRKGLSIQPALSAALSAEEKGYADDELFNLSGEIFYILKKYQKAIDYFNKALQINQYNAKSYFYKGMVYNESGEIDKAISSYRTAIEQNKEYADAYNQLIKIYNSQEDYEMAEQYLESGTRFLPEDPFLWFNYGVMVQNQGLTDSAIGYYEKSFILDSNVFLPAFNLGVMYYEKEQYSKANKRMARVLYLQPEYDDAHYMAGLILEELEEYERALTHYRHCLEINPNHSKAFQAHDYLKNKDTFTCQTCPK